MVLSQLIGPCWIIRLESSLSSSGWLHGKLLGRLEKNTTENKRGPGFEEGKFYEALRFREDSLTTDSGHVLPPCLSHPMRGCGKGVPTVAGHRPWWRLGAGNSSLSCCGCWAREEPVECWKIKPVLIKADGKQIRVIWHCSWEPEARFEIQQLCRWALWSQLGLGEGHKPWQRGCPAWKADRAQDGQPEWLLS